ncbi:MAG: amino acid ABC transporter substrate-binding protein [Caldilineales bacterium]|nr:amino acid ABC transporter substrate-binding protein [Caldilineales bacterium]
MAKVGLIAPFEGPSRPLGYAVLNAVRLRLNQWNESGGTPRLELVALNDDSNPELAAKLVAQLARDPDILFVMGPPQSHTASTAIPALIEAGIPAISLAPVPDALVDQIAPFAGADSSLLAALTPFVGEATPTRNAETSPPLIWLGDPQTLAELLRTRPDLIAAAGPVAAEEVIDAWAGDAAEGLIWAGACPPSLPPEFPAEYAALAGTQPTFASALAYAALDEALASFAPNGKLSQMDLSFPTMERPPICVYVREDNSCCKTLSSP